MDISTTIFEWVLNIPNTLAQFSEWLIAPINETYLNISPLGLFGIGGGSFIIGLIGIHIVRLFL